MSFSVRCAAAIALLAVALVTAGCGETVIDDVKAEGAIKSNLEKSLDEKITSVDCPSDEKVEKGKTFTCTVKFSDGKQATATLKILNEDADVSLVGLKPTK
ncbi:MAG TPA: DUF4333 domain-containing protein [Solirubrobacterales bacterium]|nr:DUF4333 domain-containing protein [Solirubrobacterales bacterium]